MALRVALAAGHCTNRQHTVTLALFEIRDQPMAGHTTGTDARASLRLAADTTGPGSTLPTMGPFSVRPHDKYPLSTVKVCRRPLVRVGQNKPVGP